MRDYNYETTESFVDYKPETELTSTKQKSTVSTTRKGKIQAVNLVAVRKAPLSIEIVGYVRNGDEVKILDSDENGYTIEMDDRHIGYISLKFCKEV